MTAVLPDQLPDPDLFSPGVVEDMPEEEYHAHPALSSTGLRNLAPPSCPATFRHKRDNPETNKTLDYGRAAHGQILGTGPALVELGEKGRTTREGKALAAEALADGAIAVLPREYDAIMRMAERLNDHDDAHRLLTAPGAYKELSSFWRDPRTGVPLRARYDCLLLPPERRAIVVDYKTSGKPATEKQIQRAVLDYGYHQQGAHYCDGVVQSGLAADATFVLIVQEAKAPYLVNVVELDLMWLVVGEQRNRYAIDLYQQCVKNNHWPDYNDGKVAALPMPKFAERQHEDDVERGVFDLGDE